jgi:hypothetical protein
VILSRLREQVFSCWALGGVWLGVVVVDFALGTARDPPAVLSAAARPDGAFSSRSE